MKIPYDTAGKTILSGTLPEAVTDYDTGAAKHDPTGAALFATYLLILLSSGPETIKVQTVGAPADLVVGQPVTVTDLVATTWQMGERSGVSFRASSITPANVPAIRRSDS
jgi:hypothetical protein